MSADTTTPQIIDEYSHLEAGLRALADRIDREDARYGDLLTYEQRLLENIQQARRYGDTPSRKAERAEIISSLNTLSRATVGVSYNQLCPQSISPALSSRRPQLAVLTVAVALALAGLIYILHDRGALGGLTINAPGGQVVTARDINNLTINAGDSPEERQRKIDQAKQIIFSEVFSNMRNMDARISFVTTALMTSTVEREFAELQATVAPAQASVTVGNFQDILAAQQASLMRQTFNSKPLRTEIGSALVAVLVQSEIDPTPLRAFYDQLNEVEYSSERLINWLSQGSSPTTPEMRDLDLRIARSSANLLHNEIDIAHLRGLAVLRTLGIDQREANTQLATFTQLTPRQIVDEDEEQRLLSQYLDTKKRLLVERDELVAESQRLTDQAMQDLTNLEALQINPDDTWNEVVGKAVSLRQLGRIPEAVAAFSRYGEMFSATDPTAAQYSRVAQAFTMQMAKLGVEGGVYLFEIHPDGAADQAGLRVGDIIIEFNGQTVASMVEYIEVTQDAPDAERIQLTYLRIDDATGRFVRQTVTVEGSVLRAGVMPI